MSAAVFMQCTGGGYVLLHKAGIDGKRMPGKKEVKSWKDVCKGIFGKRKINGTFFMRNILWQDWRKCQENTDGEGIDAGAACGKDGTVAYGNPEGRDRA